MNANFNPEQAGLTLPPLAPEKIPPSSNGEAALANPELSRPASGSLPPLAPLVLNSVVPLSPPTQVGAASSAVQPSVVPAPVAAEDTDLIEKEWVAKAKQIVEKTREDPYIQSKEIGRFKADYIKKRYNKEIRTDNE